MSDTSKYVNLYIENTIGLLHEYISLILKTKTEARMAEELYKEKEAEAIQLSEHVNKLTEVNANASQAHQDARNWEGQYNAMKQRMDHMTTMAATFNDAKQQLIERNKQLDKLSEELKQLK